METELTIVIPANGADAALMRLLTSLCRQDYGALRETRVLLVAAAAELGKIGDGFLPPCEALEDAAHRYEDRLRVEVVRFEAESPAARRNAGARLARTPYVLFLDPDVELANRAGLGRELDRSLLRRGLDAMHERGLHLATTRLTCLHGGFMDDVLYLANNLMQRMSARLRPFAAGTPAGMFMLWDREEFWRLGGFNERVPFAEGPLLSKGVARGKFAVVQGRLLAANGRLRRLGHGRMAWVLMQALRHRWDEQFVLLDYSRAAWLQREDGRHEAYPGNGLLSDDGL